MTLEAFVDAVRSVVRDELAGLGVCTFARVKAVDDRRQRVTVELKNDPGWVDNDIPLVAPGAPQDGVGDVPGIGAGDEVLVVFSADDVAGMTDRRGPTPDARRSDRHTNAVALPLGAYADSDTVPDHAPGERIIAHPNGAMIRMGPPGSDDLTLEHPEGVQVRLDSDPAPESGSAGASANPRESPPRHEGVGDLQHGTGAGVTVGSHGVALTPGDTDGAVDAGGYGYGGYDRGAYGGGGRQQGVSSHRSHNDPWRTELAGDPERSYEGHRHLVPQSGGGYAMTGPPLSMRETFAWFCVEANYSQLVNSDALSLQDARGFYEAWVAWLEDTVGHGLDPAHGPRNPDTTGWPYPEPVPTPGERDAFHPDGYDEGAYGAGPYGE